MTQDADKVLDHFELFRGAEYTEMFANKKANFENAQPASEVERVREWAKTKEYQEKNFAREALKKSGNLVVSIPPPPTHFAPHVEYASG